MKNDTHNSIGWRDVNQSMLTTPHGCIPSIPDNWRQGRTCYGGLTAALMYETAQRQIEDLPPVRSALINFVGPVTGGPTLSSTLQRRGRNVVNVSASAEIGQQAVARADFLFGASRESDVHVEFLAPNAPKPEDCEPFTPDSIKDMVPSFFHNFETRLIAGARPLMGDEGYIRTWSRHRDAASRTGTGGLICIGDVLPPAAMPLMRTMAPVSSMSWIINILSNTPETEDGWWQIESRLTAARGGYSTQVMRIWNTAGELVAEGLQSIAIFG